MWNLNDSKQVVMTNDESTVDQKTLDELASTAVDQNSNMLRTTDMYVDSYVLEVLRESKLEDFNEKFIFHYGVRRFEHFSHVRDKDMQSIGMQEMQIRHLREQIDKMAREMWNRLDPKQVFVGADQWSRKQGAVDVTPDSLIKEIAQKADNFEPPGTLFNDKGDKEIVVANDEKDWIEQKVENQQIGSNATPVIGTTSAVTQQKTSTPEVVSDDVYWERFINWGREENETTTPEKQHVPTDLTYELQFSTSSVVKAPSAHQQPVQILCLMPTPEFDLPGKLTNNQQNTVKKALIDELEGNSSPAQMSGGNASIGQSITIQNGAEMPLSQPALLPQTVQQPVVSQQPVVQIPIQQQPVQARPAQIQPQQVELPPPSVTTALATTITASASLVTLVPPASENRKVSAPAPITPTTTNATTSASSVVTSESTRIITVSGEESRSGTVHDSVPALPDPGAPLWRSNVTSVLPTNTAQTAVKDRPGKFGTSQPHGSTFYIDKPDISRNEPPRHNNSASDNMMRPRPASSIGILNNEMENACNPKINHPSSIVNVPTMSQKPARIPCLVPTPAPHQPRKSTNQDQNPLQKELTDELKENLSRRPTSSGNASNGVPRATQNGAGMSLGQPPALQPQKVQQPVVSQQPVVQKSIQQRPGQARPAQIQPQQVKLPPPSATTVPATTTTASASQVKRLLAPPATESRKVSAPAPIAPATTASATSASSVVTRRSTLTITMSEEERRSRIIQDVASALPAPSALLLGSNSTSALPSTTTRAVVKDRPAAAQVKPSQAQPTMPPKKTSEPILSTEVLQPTRVPSAVSAPKPVSQPVPTPQPVRNPSPPVFQTRLVEKKQADPLSKNSNGSLYNITDAVQYVKSNIHWSMRTGFFLSFYPFCDAKVDAGYPGFEGYKPYKSGKGPLTLKDGEVFVESEPFDTLVEECRKDSKLAAKVIELVRISFMWMTVRDPYYHAQAEIAYRQDMLAGIVKFLGQ